MDNEQRRIRTRSSQRSTKTDQGFLPDISSGFSQFVNPKKRSRDENKIFKNKTKRSKTTTINDDDFKEPDNRILKDITYSIEKNIIDDTQIETLAIPDTLITNQCDNNDSSWQRDIDRLMKKLEEPSISTSNILQTQNKTQIQTNQFQSTTQTNEIAIQTDFNQQTTDIHQSCEDVSLCPCVLKYSQLESLFMSKLSQYVNIIPNIRCFPRRKKRKHFRRFNRPVIQKSQNQNQTEIRIDELSSIEKIDKTIENDDHPSTLILTTINQTPNRPLVLTTSSLNENQKSDFVKFVNRFNICTTSTVESETTHIIVDDNSDLVCPLTGKIIQGICRHLFIVSSRWLNQCLEEDSIIDERPYEIRGDTSLGCDHGGMRRSRLSKDFLLENYFICLRCSSNDCSPLNDIEQVKELIQLSGGKLFQHFQDIQSIDKQKQIVLVLGLNGFSKTEQKRQLLLDTCQQFNVKCVNIHWLLISIAKYDIQPFENYQIDQSK